MSIRITMGYSINNGPLQTENYSLHRIYVTPIEHADKIIPKENRVRVYRLWASIKFMWYLYKKRAILLTINENTEVTHVQLYKGQKDVKLILSFK